MTLNLINSVSKMINEENEKLKNFLLDYNIKAISNEFTLKKKGNDISDFNLFEIISDLYYRENFHSDIIANLLNPNGKHNEKNKFLNLFIDLISNISGKIIDKNNYITCEVFTEYPVKGLNNGRIDILIKGYKNAIIIENKINNASDTYKQLYKYYISLQNQKIEVDAVVYLTLDKNKVPDFSTYSKNEIEIIENKLVIIPAYNETENELYNGWIKKAELETKNIDAFAIFRQYGFLIKKLGKNIMNTQILEKFYKEIKNGENLKTAISIKQMLEEMPKYLALKVKQEFENKPYPFKAVLIWKDTTAFFNTFRYENADLAIDIQCETEKFSISFFDRNFNGETENVAEKILKKIKLYDEFVWQNTRFYKYYNFPTEEEMMYKYIENFLEKLNKLNKE